ASYLRHSSWQVDGDEHRQSPYLGFAQNHVSGLVDQDDCGWLDDFDLSPLKKVCANFIKCLKELEVVEDSGSTTNSRKTKKSKSSKSRRKLKKKSKTKKSKKEQSSCEEIQKKAERVAEKNNIILPNSFPFQPSNVQIISTTTSTTTTTPDPVNKLGVELRSNIEEIVPVYITRLVSDDVYTMMVKDSPQGFVGGTASMTTPNLDGFESTYQSDNNSLVLKGIFVPDDGGLPLSSVLVRVYSPAGLSSTSTVDENGSFSIVLTDIPQGHNPYFITFTSSLYNVNGRRQLNGESGLPDFFWVMNDMCPSHLYFKLTWHSVNNPDGGTSDLDLHVYEPGEFGEHVFYGHQSGQYCHLDFDDTEGFGPEHVYCNNSGVNDQSEYIAQVHLFSEDSDTIPFQYQLQFYQEGALFRTENGMLPTNETSENPNYSPKYEVDLSDDASASTCSMCSMLGDPNNYLPNYCSTCEPPRFCYWCSRLSWLCDERDELDSYKMYEQLKDLNPTVQNLRFYTNTLLLPLERASGSNYNHAVVLNAIDNGNSECVKEALNNAYCAIIGAKVGEAWISAISTDMKTVHFEVVTTLANNENLSAFVSSLELDYITTVYKAYSVGTALGAIAGGFQNQVLVC
ncbi:hypothetical protein ACHAXS_002144, partial [Conticribra weissflogii]